MISTRLNECYVGLSIRRFQNCDENFIIHFDDKRSVNFGEKNRMLSARFMSASNKTSLSFQTLFKNKGKLLFLKLNQLKHSYAHKQFSARLALTSNSIKFNSTC